MGDSFFHLLGLFRLFLQVLNHSVKQRIHTLVAGQTGYGVDDHGLLAEQFQTESQLAEMIEMLLDERDLGNREIQGHREQQLLGGGGFMGHGLQRPFEQHTLVGGMLVDQHESVFNLGQDICVVQLPERHRFAIATLPDRSRSRSLPPFTMFLLHRFRRGVGPIARMVPVTACGAEQVDLGPAFNGRCRIRRGHGTGRLSWCHAGNVRRVRLENGHHVRVLKRQPNGPQQPLIDAGFVGKPDLALRGMYIDVHLLEVDVQENNGDGIPFTGKDGTVPFVHGVVQGSAGHRPGVDEQILVGSGNPGGVRPADEPVYLDEIILVSDRYHLVHERVAHDGLRAGIGVGHGGQGKGVPSVYRQREGDLRIGHRRRGYHRNDMARLRGCRPQELPAGGYVVEQPGHGDRRTPGPPGVRYTGRRSPVDTNPGPRGLLLRSGRQIHPCHGGDAGQRLPPKAECPDAIEVVFTVDFAGRMALEGQHRVLTGHAPAVVHYANELLPTRLDLHGNSLAASV